jgi:2-aminoadipate transaminase
LILSPRGETLIPDAKKRCPTYAVHIQVVLWGPPSQSEVSLMSSKAAEAINDREVRFSRRIANLHASPIREILSVIDTPGMVSFAGGLPAPETFPVMQINNLPRGWLQYGPTEGDMALREQIAKEICGLGLTCSAEQVLVLSGSQQGIDLAAKLFIDLGTWVSVEAPTYLAALQSFRFFGARFVAFNRTDPGFGWGNSRPAFVYTIPTFQNPTGHCYSAEERTDLAAACDRYAVPLFEDDPYRDLAFDPCDRVPICARLKHSSWIYQSSFSKSLAPGLRLGFMVASPDLLPFLGRLKQAADLHSNRISQWLVLDQLLSDGREDRMKALVKTYRDKRDYFNDLLRRYFGSMATWEVPSGGLFFWLNLGEDIDTRQFLPEAIRRGVAYMPGEPFFPDSREKCGALRLSFSHPDAEQAQRGLTTLSQLLQS